MKLVLLVVLGAFCVVTNGINLPVPFANLPTASQAVAQSVNLPNIISSIIPGQIPFGDAAEASDVCSRDVTAEVPKAMVGFDADLYRIAAGYYNNHFVLSEYSVWLMMSALAEATTGDVQDKMFSILHLPKEPCLRLKYYQQALKHERPGSALQLFRTRILALDNNLVLNQTWANEVRAAGLLEASSLPLISNPQQALEQLSKYSRTQLTDLKLSGDALLLDTFDYSGLWTEAFPNAAIDNNKPFYNDLGEQIGTVDYIRMQKRVRVAYHPKYNAKVLELPIGFTGQYSLMILMTIEPSPLKNVVEMIDANIINEVYDNFKESTTMIDILIPRLKIVTYHDNLQVVLEKTGLPHISETFVSQPSPNFGSFVQRISVTLDVTPIQKLKDQIFDILGLDAALHPKVGRTFIANRPFLFTLLNARTRTCVFVGAYSQPSA